jgi:MFS family permease
LGQFLGWRANFYFLAIVGGLLFFMVLFFLPETLRRKREEKVMTTDADQQTKKRSRYGALQHAFEPFKPMVGLLFYPNVMVTTLYNTVIFGSLYFMVCAISTSYDPTSTVL